MKKAFSIFIVLVFACQIIFAANIKHKYHTSFTRIDYNKQEKLLEISIKVFAHDLLPTLEKRHKKRIDLENTENVDEILKNYLAEKFVVKTQDNQVKPFTWIGKELETEVIMFYIEVPFEGSLEKVEIKNILFFETFAEQVNLVTMHFDEKQSDIVFKVGDKFKKVSEHITKKKQ